MGTKDKGHIWRQAATWLFGVTLDWSQIRCSLVLNRLRWRPTLWRERKMEEGEIKEAPCYPELHRHPALLICQVGNSKFKEGESCATHASSSLSFSLYQRCLYSWDQRGAGEITARIHSSWKISYLPPFSLLHPGDALNTLSLSVTCACLTATVHMESLNEPWKCYAWGKVWETWIFNAKCECKRHN